MSSVEWIRFRFLKRMTKLESSSLNEKFVKPENLSVGSETPEYEDRRQHAMKFEITKRYKLNASIQFPAEAASKCRSPQRGHLLHLMTSEKKIFFTVVPCILILSKPFIYQLIHNRLVLKEY